MAHIQISDTTPRIAYVATQGQTEFAVPFAFFVDADLTVYVNDAEQTLSTDYTVDGAGESDGGTITFVSGLTLGDSVVIVRDVLVARTTDFPDTGPLQVNALNTQLDRLIAIAQQLQNDIQRTLRLADSDATENLDIPAASERAGKFLAFDENGDPSVSETITGVPVSNFAATLLDDEDAATARGTLELDTDDSPQFAGIELGHASDTTLSRSGAGVVAVEGNDLAQTEPGVNKQTGTAYTLALTDKGKVVTMNNANANTLTIPTDNDVSFPPNTIINVVQIGAGVTTITGDAGVTVNGASAGSGSITNRYQGVSLLRLDTDEWVASGAIGTVT